ncbi:outer membrane protein OprM [Betaproteobacteria bacterium]|nr:outer membrane protein OprM [Betaproteobacteria bacterium]GHU01263.1 outer membrane protein OprM [Betaproteobacteria bacterium]GHU17223.1 outer membrane protein OprM [Betaproteobacteria bacterium]
MTHQIRTLCTILATSFAATACTLAPTYERPQAPVPATWPTVAAEAATPVAAELPWRDYFADPRLLEVIDLALANNRDLRVAALNIERVRALYRIQRADLYPSLDLSGGQNAQRVPANLSQTGDALITRQYSAGIGTAWELDFFGRVRSLNDQALESYLATKEARRSAQISLVAEVANAWLALAADHELLDLARRTYATQQQSVDLIKQGVDAGAASALDLSQARTAMERARADSARYRAQFTRDQNALALLTGTTVAEDLQAVKLIDAIARIAELPAGIPSEVLTRRPDVLQAEHLLRAANANIGAARAAFFPNISLTASAGTASATLDNLFEAGTGTWAFAPRITLPIFHAGALRANLDRAEIERDIQVAQYEKAIQSAFREVADALVDRATLTEQLNARRAVADAANESYRLSEARYRSGIDSHLVLLDAQRSQYAAEQELIVTRLTEASNRVVLYKVLGGGWQ